MTKAKKLSRTSALEFLIAERMNNPVMATSARKALSTMGMAKKKPIPALKTKLNLNIEVVPLELVPRKRRAPRKPREVTNRV
jgi:hypothetical protein